MRPAIVYKEVIPLKLTIKTLLALSLALCLMMPTAWASEETPAQETEAVQTAEEPAEETAQEPSAEEETAGEEPAEEETTEEEPQPAEPQEEIGHGKEWWNVLLLGSDSRTMSRYERTDSMIILSVNRGEALLKMTSIMRDTLVTYPGTNRTNRINAANVFGGPDLAMATVNSCFGMDVEEYVMINMADLVSVVDAMGGIDLEITEVEWNYINSHTESYMQEIGLEEYDGDMQLEAPGMAHLNGLLAMTLARQRYTDSDYFRVMRQQRILLAIAQKAQDMEVEELLDIADGFFEILETNMTNAELKALATVAMVVETEDVEQFRIPVDGTFESGILNEMWTIRPNFARNTQLLHDFIYGK